MAVVRDKITDAEARAAAEARRAHRRDSPHNAGEERGAEKSAVSYVFGGFNRRTYMFPVCFWLMFLVVAAALSVGDKHVPAGIIIYMVMYAVLLDVGVDSIKKNESFTLANAGVQFFLLLTYFVLSEMAASFLIGRLYPENFVRFGVTFSYVNIVIVSAVAALMLAAHYIRRRGKSRGKG